MEIQNSLVVADFIRGIYVPLGVISAVCLVAVFFLIMEIIIENIPKLWWPAGFCIGELLFALWFFSTFTITSAA